MEITSITYLAFVGISLIIYWLIPHKFQWLVLLIDSLTFYFLNASAGTIVYVCVSAISAYIAGIYFEREAKTNKKLVLFTTIIINAGILFIMKYYNMFAGTFNRLFHQNLGTINLLSSLAISYYTLQIIAYTVDTYLGSVKPERNPLKLLLFTMFFPQMVSGPISRWKDLGKQLFVEHRFDYDRVVTGMRRVLWGIAKKVVVADRLGIIVNYMFKNSEQFSGLWVIVSALVFVVELYFDFSGCMDIVIGVSKCFGILLPENFNSPFLSRSIQEIWQKWHMTLGGWLKDYIMYPISMSNGFKQLGKVCKKYFGKKGIQVPYYIAMFVVWTLMGIWHGNSWKFVIGEGWYFWAIIVASQLLDPLFKKAHKILKIPVDCIPWRVFQVIRTTILFAIGNIAFRAESLSQTFNMWKSIFSVSPILEPLNTLKIIIKGDFGGKFVLICVCVVGILQIAVDVLNYRNKDAIQMLSKAKLPIRWLIYFALAGIIISAGAFGQSQFIYFGF